MECYCCQKDEPKLHHVKLRGDPIWTGEPPKSPEDPRYKAYLKNTEYRSAFVCPACYRTLDSAAGVAEISGRTYNLAGQSRKGKAPLFDQRKYDAFQRKKAGELGIEL